MSELNDKIEKSSEDIVEMKEILKGIAVFVNALPERLAKQIIEELEKD
tara:strand:+ start:1741 stop:1884 length:144 start_codon:yes stop_codon:yes gene_type:complete